MRTPAFAFAWQLWTRHRGGIIAALAMLAVLIAEFPVLCFFYSGASAVTATFIPFFGLLGYFCTILLFVEETGSLSSNYPRRMYTLPVSTRSLVFWPMLYCASTVAVLWLATTGLVAVLSGFPLPVLLPALGYAAAMAWLQAFTWLPIANPWVRGAMMGLLISVLGVFPLWLLWMEWASQFAIYTLFAAYIPSAYAVALVGVTSDRKGETWRLLPDWPWSLGVSRRAVRRPRPFRSPAEAQLWYEWDCHGLVLPAIVAGFSLFFAAATLFQPDVPARTHFGIMLIFNLSLPALIAGRFGGNLGRLKPPGAGAKTRGSTEFLAIRPITVGGLVAAKFEMAALSVLLTYAMQIVVVTLFVVAAGYVGEASELWRDFRTRYPGWRAATILVLGSVTVPVLTWGLLTRDFAAFLAGRRWILVSLNWAFLVVFMGLGAALVYQQRLPPRDLARIVVVVPWLVAAGAAAKGIVAAWAFHAALRPALMRPATLLAILAAWLGLVACAIVLVALLLPAEGFPVPRLIVFLGVALFLPLGRFALAPLALDWNRHR